MRQGIFLERDAKKIEADSDTGEKWGVPNAGMYKHRLKLPGDAGKPDGATTEKNETLEIRGFDERGSYNAVCDWLRRLGVRWYMPGELGEVVPQMQSISLPKLDKTVRPDFDVRRFYFRFSVVSPDSARWVMRLGTNDRYGMQAAHGSATMTSRDEIHADHPDWFALYGGERRYLAGYSKNQLCYSNEERFQHTLTSSTLNPALHCSPGVYKQTLDHYFWKPASVVVLRKFFI